MSFRLIIWDFDGTLADSRGVALEIFNGLAAELGHRPVTEPEAVRGLSSREFMREHRVSFWRLSRLVRRFQAAVAARANDLLIFPGVADVLAGLQSRGARLGVLSSNREDVIRRCLRAANVEDCFGFVIGCSRFFGKGRALRRILRAEGVAPADAAYVGDEVRDVEAAKSVGMSAIAVSWGFQSEAILRRSCPDRIITETQQLLGLLHDPVEAARL
jgi:phosphoglycolate phosphatase